MGVAVNHFGAKVSQLFYRGDIDESDEARNAAVKMFNDLRSAFRELIDEAEWMDQGSAENRNWPK